jgi:lipid A disaccharide synthetase
MITKQQVIQVINILPDQFTVEQLYNKLILSERIEEALQEPEENLYTVKQVKELMRLEDESKIN